MYRRLIIAAALAAGLGMPALAYALTQTSLFSQVSRFLQAHMVLSIGLAALILLVSCALAALVYGFRMEGGLAQSGKLHDLIRGDPLNPRKDV